jgi:hypothetical protein
MFIYIDREDSLGDFLNAYPVIQGLYNSYGKLNIISKSVNKRFNGFREFLMYQGIFENVYFDDEIQIPNDVILLHKIDDFSTNEKTNINQPKDTFRYGQFMKKQYGLNFEIDDKATLIYPEFDIQIEDTYYVGDRWANIHQDGRRATNVLSYLNGLQFIDYNRPILENCYILKNLKRPFITNFTGIANLADLLYINTYIVWKPEDWAPQYRRSGDVVWDDASNINDVFGRHIYKDRNCKLVHASELPNILL